MAEWGRQQQSFDLTPFVVNEDEVRFQLGWTSDRFLTVSVYNKEVNIHIRRFTHDPVKGWIPTKTGIVLSPCEIQEFVHFLPYLGQAYHLAEQKLKDENLVCDVEKLEMDGKCEPMDIDVPKPEPMDIDNETAPSLAKEFEERLLQKHCQELIDEIHRVQRTLCYGCQYDCPGQRDHDVCLADWEEKVDQCFDTAYENIPLEPLFDEVKNELKRKFPYVNMNMLTVLAETIQSSSSNTRRDIKQRVLELRDIEE